VRAYLVIVRVDRSREHVGALARARVATREVRAHAVPKPPRTPRDAAVIDARRRGTTHATMDGAGAGVSDDSAPAKTYPRIGGGDVGGGDPWTNVDVSCPIEGYDADVWRARVDLAAAYQLCDKYGYNEGVCNHLTCVAPGREDAFLVAPYGLAWSEVTASNLVMIDGSGKMLEGRGEVDATAFFIHLAIHRAGVACVLHTHMPRASALCCVESFELAMCHQNSLRFAGDVAYDPTFNGLVLDNTEGERLVEVMDGKRVLMHKHHGVIVCGATVAEAFDDLYYLERAAEVQILAMSTGSPLSIISDEIGRKFREDMESDGGKARWARLHYDARLRELARDPLRKIFTD